MTGGQTAASRGPPLSSGYAVLDKKRDNSIYPMVIEKKPTEHEQKCNICSGDLFKGDLRIKMGMDAGYRRTKVYYFHIHCFLDKFIRKLKNEGYDVSEYVTGVLFT